MKIQPISRADLINQYSGTLSDLAANAGIDLSKINLNHPTYSKPRTKNIHNSKEFKGKVYAYVNHYRTKDGNEHFNVTFGNLKTGVKESFCSFTEWKNDNELDEIKYPTVIRATATELAIKAELEEAARIAEEAKEAAEYALKMQHAWYRWDNATGDVSTHPYAITKGLPFTGIEIRRNVGQFGGDCLIYQIFNIKGEVIGFQEIYAKNLSFRDDNKNIVGKFGSGFAVIGDKSQLRSGCILVEGLATGLAVHHSTGKKIRTQLNNANNRLPVVVCLSASNIIKVAKLLHRNGFENIKIAADNDCGLNKHGLYAGNTGIYSALKAAKSIGLNDVLVPVSKDGKSVDFANTIEFKRLAVEKNRLLYQRQLFDYVLDNSIKQAVTFITELVADKVLTQFESVEAAVNFVMTMYQKRVVLDEVEQLKITESVNEEIEIIVNRFKKKIANKFTVRTAVAQSKTYDVTDYEPSKITNMIKFLSKDKRAMFGDCRGMGVGKTKNLAALAAAMPDKKIMMLSHRVSIINDTSNRLGFDCYHDVDLATAFKTNGSRVAICINSLPKVGNNDATILFIDEAAQMHNTILTCSTIENRPLLLKALRAQMQQSELIMLCDAGLNDNTLKFYKELAGDVEVRLLTSAPAVDDRNYQLIEGSGTAIDLVHKDLVAGKPVVVGCTAKAKAEECHAELIGRGIAKERLLLITADNKRGDIEAEFLSNPNVEGLKYDGIIYSPAIASGVSLEMPKFETTYLIKGNNLSANECTQMMMRNRCAKDVYVAFDDQCGYNGNERLVTDIKVLIEGEKKALENLGYEVDDLKVAEWRIDRLRLIAQRNEDLNDSKRHFLALCQLEGRHFKQSGIVPIKIIGLSKNVREQHYRNTLAAECIDAEEFKELKQQHAVTQDETYSIKRFETVLMTGLSHEEITIDDIQNLYDGDMKRVHNFELLNKDNEEIKEGDKSNVETGHIKSLLLRKKIFNEFVAPLVAAGKKIDKRIATKSLNILKKHHAELAMDFGNYNKNFTNPVKTIDAFLDKFGYELVETNRTNSSRFFEVKPISKISLYANNRKGCG